MGYQSAIERLKIMNTQLQREVGGLKIRVNQKSEIIDDLAKEHEQERGKWSRERTNLSNKCTDLNHIKLDQHFDLVKQRDTISSLETKIKLLEDQLTEHDERGSLAKAEKSIEEFEKKISQIANQVDELKELTKEEHNRELNAAVGATTDVVI